MNATDEHFDRNTLYMYNESHSIAGFLWNPAVMPQYLVRE